MEDIITQHPTVTKGEAHQFFQAFYDHYHSMRHQLVASAAKLDGSHAEVFEDLGPIGKSRADKGDTPEAVGEHACRERA